MLGTIRKHQIPNNLLKVEGTFKEPRGTAEEYVLTLDGVDLRYNFLA